MKFDHRGPVSESDSDSAQDEKDIRCESLRRMSPSGLLCLDSEDSAVVVSGSVLVHRHNTTDCGMMLIDGDLLIKNMFLMPAADARSDGVVDLVSSPHGFWDRFWLAVAKFCLRRMS